MKYCARNQTKAVTDVYIDNYKTLLRGMKKNLNEWRESLLSWIRRYNIVIKSVLPKMIYRFSAVPIKIPADFLKKLSNLL